MERVDVLAKVAAVALLWIVASILIGLNAAYENNDYYIITKVPEELVSGRIDEVEANGDLGYRKRHESSYSGEVKTCKPISFGILPEDDDKYFIKKNFKCIESKYGILEIIDDYIHFKCSRTADYFIPGPGSEKMIGDHPQNEKWQPYRSPVLFDKSEFAFTKCDSQVFAVLKNRFNRTAFNKAKKISKALHEQSNTVHKPLIFIYLIIDSLSRQNFFRSLPKTSAFFFSNSSHLAYDFLLNSIEAWNTIPNLTPLLLGSNYTNYIASLKLSTPNPNLSNGIHSNKLKQNQDKFSLWTEFSRSGFVTAFSTESVKDFIPSVTGREILADHVIGGFWREAAKSTRFSEFSTSVQCIAGKMPHEYSLSYIKEFLQNYEGVNRAAFFHINTAHEETCTRAKELDEPLYMFLKWVLSEKNEKIVVLAGDHGRFFEPLTLESYAERLIPAHIVVADTRVMDRIGAHDTFSENQDKLLSRLDWYETIKSISKFPYQAKNTSQTSSSPPVKQALKAPGANLFFNKISKYRVCSDINIPPSHCICHNEVLQHLSKSSFTSIVSSIIKIINSFPSNSSNPSCAPIISHSINSVFKYEPEQKKSDSIKVIVSISSAYKNSTLIISMFNKRGLSKIKFNKNANLSKTDCIVEKANLIANGDYGVYGIHLVELGYKPKSYSSALCLPQ